MNQNIWSLIGFAAVALIVVGGLAFLSQHYTLDNIKSKTVGDGQYGTARWATKREIQKTYRHVPFQPELWRKGEHLPRQQGLVLGSLGRKNHVTALVDCDDIHCLMIGASGVGKTAFFLYPNLEYACASGMSYLALDTKGDLARNYGAVASKYYGYQVSVIDLRNPTRSDGNNLLTLINRYMDLARGHPDNLTYKARAEKYTKILAKSIINPEGESSRGENAYFYESAESLLAAVILLLSEYLPPTEGEPEMRHIVSVFKLVQDLLAVDPRSRDQRNGFQILMDRLPENHRAYMLAGAALTASDQAMVMMFTTAFALSPDFRASALNLLITFEEQYTQLTMNGNATGGNTSQTENSAPYDFTATYFEHLEVGWIPEGFTCTRNDYDSSALFEDSAGQFFSINRADGHGTLNVDTEDADSVVNITVNGINGIQVLKDGRIHSVLSDLEHGLFIQLRTSSGISTEIHQRILENIKYIA